MATGFWNDDTAPATGNSDPNLRNAREGEVHKTPVQPEYGEGAITGEPPDHYVHLANGAVVPGCSVGTHYHDPEMGLVPIVNRFPAGRDLPRGMNGQ